MSLFLIRVWCDIHFTCCYCQESWRNVSFVCKSYDHLPPVQKVWKILVRFQNYKFDSLKAILTTDPLHSADIGGIFCFLAPCMTPIWMSRNRWSTGRKLILDWYLNNPKYKIISCWIIGSLTSEMNAGRRRFKNPRKCLQQETSKLVSTSGVLCYWSEKTFLVEQYAVFHVFLLYFHGNFMWIVVVH